MKIAVFVPTDSYISAASSSSTVAEGGAASMKRIYELFRADPPVPRKYAQARFFSHLEVSISFKAPTRQVVDRVRADIVCV